MIARPKALVVAALLFLVLPVAGSSPSADAAAQSDIVGSIVDKATGLPIAGLMVVAWSEPINGQEHVAMGVSDADGTFDLDELFPNSRSGVTPGTYVIGTGNGIELQYSPYARQYWDAKPTFDSADPVVLAVGEIVTIEFKLALGGTIAGTVTDELTGLPIDDVGVFYTFKDSSGTPSLMEAGTTGTDGNYVIAGLGDLEHLVCFIRGDWHSECWDNHLLDDPMPHPLPGDWISMGTGLDVVDINAQLARKLPHRGTFWDDDESVFEADIEWLAAAEITVGCNPPVNDRFCPSEWVTRGQMAAFLVRAMGYTDDGGGNLFVDDDGSIFEASIDRLGTAKVTKGCNPPVNDRFCPSEWVTRGQMAAFLVRAMGYGDDGGDLFVDDDDSVFETDIDKLATAGVTRGCNPPTNDRFCPGSIVTRGQMAAFLHRALE